MFFAGQFLFDFFVRLATLGLTHWLLGLGGKGVVYCAVMDRRLGIAFTKSKWKRRMLPNVLDRRSSAIEGDCVGTLNVIYVYKVYCYQSMC